MSGPARPVALAFRSGQRIPALLEHFELVERRGFPPLLGGVVPVYRALRLTSPARASQRPGPTPSSE